MVSHHSGNDMDEFVLDIIHCHLLFLPPDEQPLIVVPDDRIVYCGCQGSLRQNGFELLVCHEVYVRVRMHTRARIFAEWRYAIITGYLPGIIVELTEVVSI